MNTVNYTNIPFMHLTNKLNNIKWIYITTVGLVDIKLIYPINI